MAHETSDLSSGSDADVVQHATDTQRTGMCIGSVLLILFMLLVPIAVHQLEFHAEHIDLVHDALLDPEYVLPLDAASPSLDMSMQSRLMHRLVLISGSIDFNESLPIEPFRQLRVPRALTTVVVEEEIEDALPGSEQEREPEWGPSVKHFHGYTTRLEAGRVYIGPFRISERLLSQYIALSTLQVIELNQTQLSDCSSTVQKFKFEYEPLHGQRGHFYVRKSAMDYRVSLRGVRMLDTMTLLAMVGSDGWLYPASLYDYDLEEFHNGTVTPAEVATLFQNASFKAVALPLWLCRVALLAWSFVFWVLVGASQVCPSLISDVMRHRHAHGHDRRRKATHPYLRWFRLALLSFSLCSVLLHCVWIRFDADWTGVGLTLSLGSLAFALVSSRLYHRFTRHTPLSPQWKHGLRSPLAMQEHDFELDTHADATSANKPKSPKTPKTPKQPVAKAKPARTPRSSARAKKIE